MQSVVTSINGTLRKLPVWPFYIISIIPAFWIFYRAVIGEYGFDPVRGLEHRFGLITFQFLIATLAVTPILRLFRINLCKFRRMIGVMTFVYACLHFAVYLFLDLQLNWSQILEDLTKRTYIIVGFLSILLMLPLALTSNDWSLRKLGGEKWRKLHWLIYPLAIFATLHFLWLVKSFKTVPMEPFVYSGLIALLLGYRGVRKLWKAFPTARPARNHI